MKKIVKVCLFTAAVLLAVPKIYAQVSVGVSISARIAPPPLPVYVQPPCPEDDYLWQPGYWAYDPDEGDYYWVPGVWVAPPSVGFLWTPPYWGYSGGVYGFYSGYWGPHVGFYGGVNYGGGYFGLGFAGGGWQGNHFRYNTAVVRVNTTIIHNTYVDRTVINNRSAGRRASFNGPGGVNVRPRPQEQQAMRERHMQPTSTQLSHQQAARSDRSQFAKVNHGRPAAVAMNKPNGSRFSAQGRPASNVGSRGPQSARQQRAQPQQHAQQQQRVQRQQQAQQQRAQPQQRVQRQQQAQPQQRVQRQQQAPQQRVQQQRAQPQQQRAQPQQQRAQPQQRAEPQREKHR